METRSKLRNKANSYINPATEEKQDSLAMIFTDSVLLDSFGRLRTSSANTLFDSQQEYGLCTRRCFDGTVYDWATNLYTITNPSSDGSVTDASGNAVWPRNADTKMVPITVSSTVGHYSILQSRQYTRYIPWKWHLVLMTWIFAAWSSYEAKLVRRSKTSWSVVDEEIAQSSWNVDPFDWTWPSGITLDLTKTQILFIQAQWLGVWRVVVWFDIDGILYPAHQFLHANVLTVPYTQSFNLPVRFEGTTVSDGTVFSHGYFDSENGIFLKTKRTTKWGTCHFVCCTVQTEWGEEQRGFPHAIWNWITSISCNATWRPILSLRHAATVNWLVNRTHIEEVIAELSVGGWSAYWELRIGGTHTWASWASAGTDSVAEYDISATAHTWGIVIASGFVDSWVWGSRWNTSWRPDTRNPLTISKIDSQTAVQVPITLFVQAFTGTVTANGAFNWHEQVV